MASNELAAKLRRRSEIIERAELIEKQQKFDADVDSQQHGRRWPESATATGAETALVTFSHQSSTTEDDEDKQITTAPWYSGSQIVARLPAWNPGAEFKEFSRKQLQHYQKMFVSYDVNKDKFIDFEELKHMMEKLGCPQTHLALKAMIRQVDEDRDNRISYREFLLIFRKAMAGEFPEGSGLYDIYRLLTEIDVDKEGVTGAAKFFEAKIAKLTEVSKFEQEIKDEQEEKKRLEEERRQRKQAFIATVGVFQQQRCS